jgi:hypothetical protein
LSTQGAASNRNGRSLEDQVSSILDELGLTYEKQVRRFPGIGPSLPIHDFVVDLDGSPLVIECKSVSDIPGSIWQKIPYAVDVLASHGTDSLLVLGGHPLTDWRYGYLQSRCSHSGVGISPVTSLRAWLAARPGVPA